MRRFHEELLRLFDGFYDKVDDALYDLADKSANDSSYAGYFVAMRLFRKRRPACRLAFARRLHHASEVFFKAVSGDSSSSTEPKCGDATCWRASDTAETEEALVLENMVSKSTSRYRQILEELNRALAQAIGLRTIPIAVNPFGPGTICTAFQAALTPFASIDLPVKLVVYKLFDKQVMDHLGRAYATYLEGLSALSPNPRAQPGGPHTADQPLGDRRDKREPDATARQRLSTDALPDSDAPPIATTSADLARLHQRLYRIPRPAALQCPAIDTSEVVATLTQLQPLCPRTRAPRVLRAWLCARLTEGLGLNPKAVRARRLREHDEASIEVVLQLFEQILAAPDLPAPIKPLIARLALPILKVALLDETFFTDPSHPARQLLNRAGRAAIGWTDDGDRSAASLYGVLARTVEQITGRFTEDVAIFAEQSAQLDAALAPRANLLRAWEEKARRVAAGRARASSCERMVAAVIHERLRGYENVPPSVVELLEDGWSRVLNTAYLRSGADSEAWREGLSTIDRLLWSVCPKFTQEERRELLQAIPTLLRKLRLTLAESSAEPRKVSNWFRELQPLHMAALRGDSDTLRVHSAERPSGAGLAVAAEPNTAATTGSAPSSLQLAVGTWIQLAPRDNQPVRLKLIWQDLGGAQLLFVDAARRKGVELDIERVTMLIARGTATVVGNETEGLVERAIAAVTKALETE